MKRNGLSQNDVRKTYNIYVLLLLSVVAISAVSDRFILSILISPIKDNLKLDDIQIALLNGIAFASFYATMGVPIAYLADRWSRSFVIAGGLIVWSAATVTFGLSSSFAVLFVSRMVVGVGEAALNPACYSLLADLFDRRALPWAIGLFQSALQLAIGLSMVVGGSLFALFTAHSTQLHPLMGLSAWRLTMLAVALPGAPLAALVLATIRDRRRQQAQTEAPGALVDVWKSLIQRRGMLALVILGYCPMAVSGYGILAWYPSFLTRVYGIAPSQAAVMFGTAAASSGWFGAFTSGVLAQRLHPRFGNRAPLIALLGASGGAFITAVAPLLPGHLPSLIGFGIGNVAFGMSTPLVASLIQLNAPRNLRARISGIWVCLFNLAGYGLGPLCVGFLGQLVFARNRLDLALATNSAAMLTLAFLIFLWVYKRTSNESQQIDL